MALRPELHIGIESTRGTFVPPGLKPTEVYNAEWLALVLEQRGFIGIFPEGTTEEERAKLTSELLSDLEPPAM